MSIFLKKFSDPLYIPKKPTWDLEKVKYNRKKDTIDASKLETLSLLKIDQELVNKLENVVDIVERMCQLDTKDTKPLIHFDHLGSCKLRNDNLKNVECFHNENVLKNSKKTYDNYFIAPSTQTNTEN